MKWSGGGLVDGIYWLFKDTGFLARVPENKSNDALAESSLSESPSAGVINVTPEE